MKQKRDSKGRFLPKQERDAFLPKQKRDSKGRFLPKDKVYATGIKGFKPGLICKPNKKHKKQYAENTVFEEEGGDICGPGMMHAANTAMDVLDYVPLVNLDGSFSEFAEVEALAPVQREDGKWVTTKLRVGKKLSFKEFVKAYVSDVFKLMSGIETSKAKRICNSDDYAKIGVSGSYIQISTSGDYTKIGSSGNYAHIGSSGDWAQIASSGDETQITSSGNDARIASSGDETQITSSGYGTRIGSSGDWAQIASSGYRARIASSGDETQIASSSNDAQIASSGYRTRIASSGNWARIASSGDETQITSSGNDVQIGSVGDKAKIISSGFEAEITSKGSDSVVAALGKDSIVSAELGSWITLAEYTEFGECICVKASRIDGVKLKPGVSYRLENGEFKEVK